MAKKKTTAKQKPGVYEFTVSLVNTKPLVWRKFLAHEIIDLDELHMLIQITMGWNNAHLYAFEINRKFYSDEESAVEMDYIPSNGIELRDVLGSSKKFTYTYDFGDDWLHEIEITNTLEDDPKMNYPVCIAGENACPPEDCGGPHSFENLKKVISGKNSKEKDELLTWLGGFYNPATFDPNFVNKFFLWDDSL
ncbi:MAG: plasmid pRiA4b ORF-3 family protein [Halobacteriovoraceae bacterium]|nr:plasmid pRiA4b ORF-3 family protein [Halobacteriovoraceae bacterium]